MIDRSSQQTPNAAPRPQLSRRALLGAGLAASAAIAGVPLSGRAQVATPAASALVEGVDVITSPLPGVPDAFLRAPEPYISFEGVPGAGGTVRLLSLLFGPPPPGRGDNSYWQDLEARLGATYDVNFVPYEQYGERTAAVLAGGDLPELFYVNPEANAPHLTAAIPQGAFADLTDYLTGEAAAEFPNLAAIDPAVLTNISINGRVYGVPKLIPRFDNTAFYRNDWRETLGLPEPENAEDFFALMDAFTNGDPDGDGSPNTWGLGGVAGGWNVINGGYLQRMFRVPNVWRLEADGTLTNAVESEEYAQAIEFAHRLYAAGLYHPDTPTMTFEQEEGALLGGQIGLQIQGFGTFLGSEGLRGRIRKLDPDAQLDGLVLPGWDGGDGVTFNGSGAYGFTAVSATAGQDPERVRELLRILDYLMAPFASEEQIFLEYGIEGVHHTVSPNGARLLNDLGASEIGYFGYFPLIWVARPEPQALFYPDAEGEAEYAQSLAVRILERGIDNPTLGLFSQTNADKGAELLQLEIDRVGQVVTGRSDLTALADFVAEWRGRGGDQMRQEYQDALAARG